MTWLREFDIYTQCLIVLAFIVVSVLMFNFGLYLANIKLHKSLVNYVYAFSSGFLIITAIVGQFVTARTEMNNHWSILNESWSDPNLSSDPTLNQTLVTMSVIGIGFVVGVLIAFVSKKIAFKMHNKPLHQDKNGTYHSHALETLPEHMEYHGSDSLSSTFMIVAHRVPAGIGIGLLLFSSNQTDINGFYLEPYAFSNMITFILHIFPESLLMYISLVQAKKSRLKAVLITSLYTLIFIPLVFFGAFVGEATKDSDVFFIVLPFLYSMIAAIMLWVIISEIIPVFIHIKNDSKQIYYVIFTFMVGVFLSCLIQLIHFH